MLDTNFDENLGAVLFRSEGLLTAKEYFDGVKALFANPRFHPELRFLADHTQGDFSAITCTDMTHIAKLNQFSPTARKAVLIKKTLQTGLFNVLSAYHDIYAKHGYRYFYHRPEALAYLNDGYPPDKHIR
jgi:hypothetical protein